MPKDPKTYEDAVAMLHGLVGHYEEMKPLTEDQEIVMCAIAQADIQSGFSGRPLSDANFNHIVKEDKFTLFTTMLYLYCNWRVWMTYDHDEELARKYQSVCDDIDDYIFNNYDKESIAYFVKETD